MTGDRVADGSDADDPSRDWMVRGADGKYVEQYDETDVLRVLKDRGDKAEPLTAREISDVLDRSRRPTLKKCKSLAADGVIRSKRVGARARVFWIPLYSGLFEGDTYD